ncbi:MAG: TlpA family protein disulfide reductase [Caldilineae bacterium]|nr:MAG: TlpA family protein disulfide reductase [Caldilineae bacterium]
MPSGYRFWPVCGRIPHAGVFTNLKRHRHLMISRIAALLLAIFLVSCSFTVSSLPALDGREPAPDFRLPTPDGLPLALHDFRGKVVFVNFWGTYCPPCVEEMPALQTTYEALAAEDFVILGVNVEEKPEAVKAWMQEHGLTFPTVISDDATINPLFALHRMPTTWFVDANGILRGRMEGPLKADVALRIARLLLDERNSD